LKNLTNDQIKELADLAAQMESLSDSRENFTDHFVLNREFHLNLYKPAGWNHLHSFAALSLDQILIFRSCLCRREMYKDLSKFNKDHRNILKAIRDKEADKLKAFVKSNVQSGIENIRRNYSVELQQQIDSNVKTGRREMT